MSVLDSSNNNTDELLPIIDCDRKWRSIWSYITNGIDDNVTITLPERAYSTPFTYLNANIKIGGNSTLTNELLLLI
jgi:hypothetical protein